MLTTPADRPAAPLPPPAAADAARGKALVEAVGVSLAALLEEMYRLPGNTVGAEPTPLG